MHAIRRSAAGLILFATTVTSIVAAPAQPVAVSRQDAPAPDCKAHVGYDLNAEIPGFIVDEKDGSRNCVPVTQTAQHPPPGYKGDFYVDEFTDAKLREHWAQCKADSACYARLQPHIESRLPPNKEHKPLPDRARYLLGKIDADNNDVDLKTIRRPAFFAQAPYRESIAAADPHTYIVEFTAPHEPFETLKMHMTGDIRLRGWYLQGAGVPDGHGGRVRALVIMSNGGGGRLTGIQDPADHLFHLDSKTGESVLNHFPNATTGAMGQSPWRYYLDIFYRAGFDVLSYDRRGVGLSGGYSDTNTLQQGRDILKAIQDLRTGDGMRVLTPASEELKGSAAAAALMAGARADTIPILLGGSSRGTMSTGFAMTRNFDKACDYDMPVVTCAPALGLKNIKGAIQLADYSAGPGYVTEPTDEEDIDRALFTAGTEVEDNIVFFPSSAILAGLHTWPGLFIGRGVWDYAESLEGAVDAYHRVKGLKELVLSRGPHPFETWPQSEEERIGARMVAFATAAALGQSSVPGAKPWSNMRDLVAQTPDLWEPSSAPHR